MSPLMVFDISCISNLHGAASVVKETGINSWHALVSSVVTAMADLCRKKRLAAERRANQQVNQQAAASNKKAKKQALLQENDDPTPEELHRRRMRAGRFGSGAVDHSNARPQAPVYAVSHLVCVKCMQLVTCLV